MNLLLITSVLLLQVMEPSPKQTEADSLFNKSKTFWYNNQDSAIYYLNETLRLSTETGNLKLKADALKGLGFLSYSRNEKLSYYVKSLEIRRQIKDSVGIGVSLLDIGTIYEQIGNAQKSMEYYQQSFLIREKIKDHGGMALCLLLFGHQDEAKNNFAEALLKYQEALYHRRKSGEPNGIAFAHVNMAQAFLFLKQYDSALHYSRLAGQGFLKANNKKNITWSAWVESRCYYELKQYNRALATQDTLERIVRNQDLRNTHYLSILQLKSEIYEAMLNFEKAYTYQKEWLKRVNEQKKQDDEATLRSQIADYEFKIKQEELAIQEQERITKENRIRNLQFLIIVVFLVASFIVIILVRKKASARALEISTFLVFLFLFEFLIVLVDPALQAIGGSTPLILLLGNAALALLISPFHHWVSQYFKRALLPGV